LEGIALVLIFIWDRLDSRSQHHETLKQLAITEKQAEAAKLAAEATMESVKLQKVAMQQWIETTDWHIDYSYIPREATESLIYVDFDIENPTKFKLILRSVDVWLDRAPIGSVLYGRMFLSPDETANVRPNTDSRGKSSFHFETMSSIAR
jgi:hypothetical protein